MKTFRKGGVHPPENKISKDCPIVEMPVPAELRIMLSQCIGVPAKPIVKPGEKISCGQMIAEAAAFVSAPVHSPVNGTVKKIEPTRTPQGIWQDSILIETDIENPVSSPEPRTDDEVNSLTPKEIIDIVGECGIVGLGGATFPTKVKLSVPQGKHAGYVLINGAECEPCLTCDDALMRQDAEKIMKGTLLIMKATGAEAGIIGIEENKPQAIQAMKEAASRFSNLEVVTLKKKYPQGGEKQLIFAITGRVVPAGSLPIETGCIVDNVATAYAVYDAVYNRRPLTERIVTVTGPDLSKPGNFRVKNGTSLNAVLEFAGGIPENTGKIIAGGPMMGRAVSTLDTPATKGLSGLVVLPLSESFRKKEGPCIRCARCVSVCPMGLEPYLLMLQADAKRWDDMAANGIMNCLECGCCTYTCPSYRPLLDMIKLGKQELRKKK
ncbi:MAG: electron transport complex subunit RsxC [Muribaculaceae bacterium]|nr:electron transport complex subunit RsxC [Muribaculaceae bacterium]